ncbi:ABC transporter ATP-binding protein [Catellatospora methionotrophica]|uniref:ABC transporter ATP-binding protein n=1 Tax=Catellatospora methionotrophica TaxID=121620 RepID=A0A8J3L998_9ACTN|nr:ABC transporter ATP-binding protein [Catellatospora methionotrophica]GIG16733.1 ABC transporter ATP-binding protein [Catellatospora methionotrophica]
MSFVEITGLSHRFGRDRGGPVLSDVTLSVRRSEFVAVLGPSGCGKSTLLNVLAGLVSPTEGTVTVGDGTVRIGYVFQAPRLLPWRTARRNVEFGLEQTGASRSAVRERAAAALELVHLAEHADKYPNQLSGGMQQRVALARGLAIEPDLLLMDEPFAALDALTRSYLQEELLSLVRRTDSTTILVTHDIDEALLLADRVVVMTQRPARIASIVDVPFGPERSVASLIADERYPELRTSLRELLRPQVTAAAGPSRAQVTADA